MTAAEIAAERAASLARRAEEEARQVITSRARRILAGRWNAEREELREAAIKEMPWLGQPGGADDLEELLRVAAELQATGRRRIDPAAVKVRTPEWEPKSKRRRMREPARKRETETMTANAQVGAAASAPPEESRETPAPADQEPERGKRTSLAVDLRSITKPDRDRLHQVVRRELRADPHVKPEKIRSAVATEMGWQLVGFQVEHLLKKVRASMKPKKGDRGPAPAETPNPDPRAIAAQAEAAEPAAPASTPPPNGAVDRSPHGLIQREDRGDGQSRILIDVIVPTEVAHVLYLRAYAEVHDLEGIAPQHRNGGGTRA